MRRLTRKKGQKYHNKKVDFDGITFDSTKECKRYVALKEAEQRGIIHDLQLQVKYEIIPSIKEEYIKHLKTKDKVMTRTLQRSITYTCDFQYRKGDELIVEDVKASPKIIPKEYELKEKLMFWKFGIKIQRVYEFDKPI